MNRTTSLIVLASLAIALAGCVKHSQDSRINDLGIIDVTSGKPSTHTLADGRVFIVTPTVLPNGSVSLKTVVDDVDGARKTLTIETSTVGQPMCFAFDKSTALKVFLRK
jgi:hypothetical protein